MTQDFERRPAIVVHVRDTADTTTKDNATGLSRCHDVTKTSRKALSLILRVGGNLISLLDHSLVTREGGKFQRLALSEEVPPSDWAMDR